VTAPVIGARWLRLERYADCEHAVRTLRDRQVDELAPGKPHGLTTGAFEGVDDAGGPRALLVARREDVVEGGQLAGVDGRLAEEAERARERRLRAEAALVAELGVDAVDRRIEARPPRATPRPGASGCGARAGRRRRC